MTTVLSQKYTEHVQSYSWVKNCYEQLLLQLLLKFAVNVV